MSKYSTCSSMAEVDALCVAEAQLSCGVKRKVGAVLIYRPHGSGDYLVIAKGHNYNPDGTACELPDGTTKPTVVHAEIACIYAISHNPFGVEYNSLKEALNKSFPLTEGILQMVVTYKPCGNCQAALDVLGIEAIVSNGFMKFDSQKPRMALVPASLGTSCARALTYGAKKYKPNNWRLIDNVEQYISALTRHLDAWKEGEENDPESGLCHLDHVAANLSFLIELKSLPKIKL